MDQNETIDYMLGAIYNQAEAYNEQGLYLEATVIFALHGELAKKMLEAAR